MIIQDSPTLILHRTYRYKGQIRPYQKSWSLVVIEAGSSVDRTGGSVARY